MFKYKLFVNVFILLHVYVQLSPVLKLWVEGLIPYYKSRKFNMKEENYNYRTSQTLLHNQFPGKGKCQIPIIPKFPARADAFNDVLLIGFNKIHLEDQKHLDRMVHFFLYDYRFERVWKNPDNDIEKLSRYRTVLSPNFSMYLEMAPVMQLYNVFCNRWCGAYRASKGIRVIPTVSWSDESTFVFFVAQFKLRIYYE